jgi:hypothetical protein
MIHPKVVADFMHHRSNISHTIAPPQIDIGWRVSVIVQSRAESGTASVQRGGKPLANQDVHQLG